MCEDLWANIRRCAKIYRQISADVRRYAVGKYQKTFKDLLANISRRAKFCCGQISEEVPCEQYQQKCKDLQRANIRSPGKIILQISADMPRSAAKYQKLCKDLWANIRTRGKICGHILADVRRSSGKSQQTCEDLWLYISSCAKLRGQILADAQRSALGKYQNTFENLWANISRHVKISRHRVVWAQNNKQLCAP